MPKILTDEQVRTYHELGYSAGAPVLTNEEVKALRAEIEAYEARVGHPLDFPQKSKSYLLFNWADALVHHQKVLDAVEDLIGPNILVYHSTMWIKEANTPAYVLWHQDSTHFYLDPQDHVTAWVALSEASEEAGCVRVIPGSHKLGQLDHFDAPSPMNMIRRGQGVGGYAEDDGITLPLKAGEVSMHNTRTVHASGPNNSNDRRMGYGISFIPTHVKPTGPVRPSTLLVRGVDEYKHFVPERRLRSDPAEADADHAKACDYFVALQNAGFAAA
jgi:ectoine hydroxylase-related dioxygenase (phytanoyl-CoA dioxygenase family)